MACSSNSSEATYSEDNSCGIILKGSECRQHSVKILNKNVSEETKRQSSSETEDRLMNKLHLKMCSNPDCGSTENLRLAPYFVCAYFSIAVERYGARRVCQRCYRDAENHQNVLLKMLCDHKSIVLGPKKPKNEMVTIDDEDNTEESIESPEEVEIEGDTDNFINYLIQKYRFRDQIDASLKHLGKYMLNSISVSLNF